jgi:hypothetical protein
MINKEYQTIFISIEQNIKYKAEYVNRKTFSLLMQ